MADQTSTADNGKGHVNFPASAAFQQALREYCDTHAAPIGKADGPEGRPSVAYAVVNLCADKIGYIITDADRTSGRSEVSDDERKLLAGAKTLAKRIGSLTPEQQAMLKSLGLA